MPTSETVPAATTVTPTTTVPAATPVFNFDTERAIDSIASSFALLSAYIPDNTGSSGSNMGNISSSGSNVNSITGLFDTTYDDTIKKFHLYIETVSYILNQYKLEKSAYKTSQEFLNKLIIENDELTNKLDMYMRMLNTNERKVVYLSENNNDLLLYRKILSFIYYFIIVGYIAFGNFIPDKLYNKKMTWVIILMMAAIPLILNTLVRCVIVSYDVLKYWLSEIPHKDVYTNIDETLSEIVNKA